MPFPQEWDGGERTPRKSLERKAPLEDTIGTAYLKGKAQNKGDTQQVWHEKILGNNVSGNKLRCMVKLTRESRKLVYM